MAVLCSFGLGWKFGLVNVYIKSGSKLRSSSKEPLRSKAFRRTVKNLRNSEQRRERRSKERWVFQLHVALTRTYIKEVVLNGQDTDVTVSESPCAFLFLLKFRSKQTPQDPFILLKYSIPRPFWTPQSLPKKKKNWFHLRDRRRSCYFVRLSIVSLTEDWGCEFSEVKCKVGEKV